jgi:hypothetical protein
MNFPPAQLKLGIRWVTSLLSVHPRWFSIPLSTTDVVFIHGANDVEKEALLELYVSKLFTTSRPPTNEPIAHGSASDTAMLLGVTLLQLEQLDLFVTPLNSLEKLRDAKGLDPHKSAWHDVIQTCLEYQTDAAE